MEMLDKTKSTFPFLSFFLHPFSLNKSVQFEEQLSAELSEDRINRIFFFGHTESTMATNPTRVKTIRIFSELHRRASEMSMMEDCFMEKKNGSNFLDDNFRSFNVVGLAS